MKNKLMKAVFVPEDVHMKLKLRAVKESKPMWQLIKELLKV